MHSSKGASSKRKSAFDIDSDGLDGFVLPSQRKKSQKRRPPKKEHMFDDFVISEGFSEKEEETKPKAEQKKTTKSMPIEENITNYLDRALKEVSDSFLDEFSFLTEKAFAIDSYIAPFIDEIVDETRKVINEETKLVIDDYSDLENRLNTRMQDQFDSIRKLLNFKRKKPVENQEPLLPQDIDVARENFVDSLTVATQAFEAESMDISSKIAPADQALYNTWRQLKMKSVSLRAVSQSLEDALDGVDEQLRSLEQRQAEYRERQVGALSLELAGLNDSVVSDEIPYKEMVLELRDLIRRPQGSRAPEIAQACDDEVREVSIGVEALERCAAALASRAAAIRRIQAESIRIAAEEASEPSSMITGSLVINDPMESSSVLMRVREGIKKIQSKQADRPVVDLE